MARMQQLEGPTVTVSGPVRIPRVAWTPELTLAKAILAADYYAPSAPTRIIIIRNARELPIDPSQLLAGQDIPLEVGDVVRIE